MSLAGCQTNLIDVNFHLQKSLEIFDKKPADKISCQNCFNLLGKKVKKGQWGGHKIVKLADVVYGWPYIRRKRQLISVCMELTKKIQINNGRTLKQCFCYLEEFPLTFKKTAIIFFHTLEWSLWSICHSLESCNFIQCKVTKQHQLASDCRDFNSISHCLAK